MTTITSACGTVETVTVRRTESCDAQQIHDLINPSTVAVFGRVNVIHLLERANLAVTLANAENEVLAHAAFFDCPVGGVVDQALWEPFLHRNFSTEKCTTLNTLFLHLFVAQSSFATASVKEIVRAVFNVITELQYICLVSPNISRLEPALDEVFEPMKRRLCDPAPAPGPQCLAFVCHRHSHCPALHVRRARVEDHDDLTHIFTEQSKELSASWGPFYLAELIESQDHVNQAAVCESGGIAVGFISVSGDVDLELLNESFELGMFDGLYKQQPQHAPQAERSDGGICTDTHVSAPPRDPAEKEAEQVENSSEQDEVHVSPPSETAERENTHGASGWSGSPKNQPDAFCVRLFVIDKNYEMRSVDFLPHIFTLFPDRDYCVLTLTTLAHEFPLIQNFVRVAPRPASTLSQELYVFHRAALLKCVEVRPALSADRPAVCAMVERLSVHESLLEDLDVFCHARRDPDGTPLQAFVAEVQSQIVGVLIIRNEEDVEYIRSHYNVENFIYFSQHRHEDHARLWHFVLLPVFQRHAKHFLKEALRLARKTCLYYRVYPPRHRQNSCVNPAPCVLSCMVPARPRRQIAYPLEELGVNAPSGQVTREEQAPYALNLLSRKLSMEPKVTINARMVVVGASDTALSFLETLVFCPHLWFNNVTLISTHGYPGNRHHNNDDISFLSTSHGYSSRDCVHLCCVVRVVTGTMVAIDREDKHVRVSGDRTLPYDHLILCTGLQYQVPCPTGVDLNGPITNSQLLAQPQRGDTGHVPSNLFTLNDRQDCTALHLWLSNNFMEQEDNAIVYGNAIDVYTCVEALLGLGVQGSRIHLVLLPPSPAVGKNSATCCFADPVVERAVARALEKAGVRVHRDCLLALMNRGEEVPEPLASVSFTTDGQPLHLTCGVFINLSSRGVDLDAFKSLSDARLVFDGRLVIDAGFHTNDASVHAAGPLTKFSRRYRADGTTHSCFSSREVGCELAAALLALFDPTVEPAVLDTAPDSDRLIPVYTQPRIQGGRLPGGYNYLHITKPSIPDPTVGPSFIQQSTDIVTGRVETGNYFHLRLSRYDTVEGLTCLSLKPLPVSNYLCLYGKHQRLLNQLSSRYDEGLVHDLYSFFRETWCMALYHDRFTDFEQEIKQIIESAKAQGRGGAGSMTTQGVEGNPKLFLQLFDRSGGLAALRSSTLNYLQYNRNHLPMYALPGML